MKTISGIPLQSWILVLIQFICLATIFLSGPVIADKILPLIIEISGLSLGIWAIFVMNPLTLNVFPDVRKEASFVGIGPYRFIRHPMYLAVILFSLSLLLEKFTLFRSIFFVVLLTDLIIKIEYEEKILMGKYHGYEVYRLRTKKLIPFIY